MMMMVTVNLLRSLALQVLREPAVILLRGRDIARLQIVHELFKSLHKGIL